MYYLYDNKTNIYKCNIVLDIKGLCEHTEIWPWTCETIWP